MRLARLSLKRHFGSRGPRRSRDIPKPSGQNTLMQTLIETERLALRRSTADDIDNLVELDSDPQVMRFINGGRPTPRDELENEVLPWILILLASAALALAA